jgi:uncharacterized protein YyaL (SSP411 family)
MTTKTANRLINESSPYLLQHAYNPVDWYPWGSEALEKARKEDKALLISIGYSACHWCHVMEKECFEDEEVAQLMNKYFVCIKIDREERPDIDSLYMLAVQLMTQRGGWPLNCFALPDGRPIYGGTYFPKQQWINVLEKIHEMYHHQPVEVQDYANKLSDGILQTELFKLQSKDTAFEIESLKAAVEKWKASFDYDLGGPNRIPKFPMPVNYSFLLDYGILFKDEIIIEHVKTTLDAMGDGGIYDQIGGGFSRYSVDAIWKVPHFEKMLYDNAQLISLYAKASVYYQDLRYQEIVNESISFLEHDLKGKENIYFSALDADSEGEEGKFYVWTKDELEKLSGKNFTLLNKYFEINNKGLWEHGNYILMRQKDIKLSDDEKTEIQLLKKQLLKERNKRIKPGLDDKALLGWNALSISALCDAYKHTGNAKYLDLAQNNYHFIAENFKSEKGMYHTFKNGKATIPAFLDDYAAFIAASVDLFCCTGDEDYFNHAVKWLKYVDENFQVDNTVLYYYSENIHGNPITRQIELTDNVIPSSNAMLAYQIYLIGSINGKTVLKTKAIKMLNAVKDELLAYPAGYALWAKLKLMDDKSLNELVFTGPDAEHMFLEWNQKYVPGVLTVLCPRSSDVPLLKGKHSSKNNQIYLCEGQKCYAPVNSINELNEMFNKY